MICCKEIDDFRLEFNTDTKDVMMRFDGNSYHFTPDKFIPIAQQFVTMEEAIRKFFRDQEKKSDGGDTANSTKEG